MQILAFCLVGAGDFNGDHKPDLIVHYNNGTCRSAAVLLEWRRHLSAAADRHLPSIYPAEDWDRDFDGME
jgi:hypothetical protein